MESCCATQQMVRYEELPNSFSEYRPEQVQSLVRPASWLVSTGSKGLLVRLPFSNPLLRRSVVVRRIDDAAHSA
ncbi:unnamed protein product [Soboliphyme baturini]|uniref:DUF5641 domain-containing protein n=1 Tax=Soboliphyme baturini TaxID=241478 RepID=A0A183J0J1_9BILA|nr:unnamed protein product [Soboliphyme baturini]